MYWTCFGFKDCDIEDIHCTHQYIGTTTNQEVTKIKKVISQYFKEKPFRKLEIPFDTLAMFGPEFDIRVLRCNEGYGGLLLPELRLLLNPFLIDPLFAEYKPHITTDKNSINIPINRYALLKNDEIILSFQDDRM